MHSPSPFLFWSFGLYALLVAVQAARLAGRPLLLWVVITGGLASSGLLVHFESFPPPVMRLILPALLVTGLLCGSSLGRNWVDRFSLAGLIGFQAFRLPLELLMHVAAREGVMPPQMTFTGRNFDILTGLLALPLAWLVARGRVGSGAVWAWNVLGLALLVNVVGVAVLSFPGPYRVFLNEPANLWIAYFPFVWLPTVLVPLALAGHLLVARKLLTGARPAPV
jgi:hypothetical protein